MIKLTHIFILLPLLSSCALLSSSNEKRKIQSKLISKISEKRPEFAKCAKKHDIFKAFQSKRVRVTLFLSVEPLGKIESFRLDEKRYSEGFSNCMFNITDLINFPKTNDIDAIEIKQPFIFSKK